MALVDTNGARNDVRRTWQAQKRLNKKFGLRPILTHTASGVVGKALFLFFLKGIRVGTFPGSLCDVGRPEKKCNGSSASVPSDLSMVGERATQIALVECGFTNRSC